jgi:hypothetical protein
MTTSNAIMMLPFVNTLNHPLPYKGEFVDHISNLQHFREKKNYIAESVNEHTLL